MKFVSLHHHDTFSYGDGYGTPADHAALAAEYGMRALAGTQHGNVSNHVQQQYSCLKNGIEPIFGLEAYTALEEKSDRKCHLTILAMDQTGLANLYRLVTESWDNYHRWPTVYGATLAKYQEGLIVLSGCLDSLMACSLLGGKMIAEADASWERAVRLGSAFKDLLGDRFYLECQIFPELPRALQVNEAWERMGKLLKIPLVGTADVHTVKPGQQEIRAMLHAASRGKNTIAQQLSSWEYDVPDYIPQSDQQVFDRLKRAGLSLPATREALRNTGEIADRCIGVRLPVAEQFQYPATESELKW